MSNFNLYDYLSDFKVLTKAEEIELFKRYHNGDKKAYETLIKCNLRLVFTIAREFCSNEHEFDDLFQEGTLGLMTAIQKFDETLGNKFSSYLVPCLKGCMKYVYNSQNRLVHIPTNVYLSIRKYHYLKEEAEKKGLSFKAKDYAEKLNLSTEEFEIIRHVDYYTNTKRLDCQLVDLDECESLIDSLEVIFSDEIESVNRKLKIEEFIYDMISGSSLTEKERKIISMYYGLNGKTGQNFAELGKHFGLTHQGCTQTHDRGMEKIKRRIYKLKMEDIL